jgi:hypothetical protein
MEGGTGVPAGGLPSMSRQKSPSYQAGVAPA